jgi:hypothetical protein
MAWWEKGLKTVMDQGEKVKFEADKLVRVKREEGVAVDLRTRMQSKLGELGQVALDRYRSGAFKDPAMDALVQEIGGLEDQAKAQDAKIEAMRAEQWQGATEAGTPPAAAPQVGGTATAIPVEEPAISIPLPESAAAPAQPLVEQAPAAPAPAAPMAPSPAAPAATMSCPNCNAQVRSSAAFCPECGTKLK